jgi:hypothetical protein
VVLHVVGLQMIDALNTLVTACHKVVSTTSSAAPGSLPRHAIPGMDPSLLTSRLPQGAALRGSGHALHPVLFVPLLLHICCVPIHDVSQ